MGFAAAAGAAITDGAGATGEVANASGGAGGELAVLEDNASAGKVEELILGATVLLAELNEFFQLSLRIGRK